MGKLSRLFFGGALAGALGATIYTYVKKYNELAPKAEENAERGPVEGEEAERSYTNLDMDAAKEAAKQTAETVKAAALKAWGVAKDSAKDVYDNVRANYGEEIDAAKEKVTEKYGEVKETAGEKWEEVKATVTERFETYKSENPEAVNKFGEFKENAKKFYDDAVEKVGGVVDRFLNKDEVVDGEAEEVCDAVKDACEDAQEACKDAAENVCDAVEKAADEADKVIEDVIDEMKDKANEFVQQ